MVDLKKFVAYFLVLASIASSAVFMFSGFLNAPAPNTTNQTISTAEKTPPLVSENAFVEKIPDSSPKVDIEPGLPPIIMTGNLTQNVSQGLTREFFRANMNGPQDINGEKAVSLPSNSQIDKAIVNKLASKETAALVTLPNFNEGVPQSQFNVNSNNSPEELGRYFAALNATFKDTILSKDFNDLMKGDPSFDAVSAAQLAHSRALYNLKSMPVPSSLAAFHASALKLVLNAKKIVDVPTQDGDDPLKTLAVMKEVSGKIELVLTNDFENFRSEFKKLEAQNISIILPEENGNPIGRIFVKEAHAILGVNISTIFDLNSISTNVSTYGSWIRKIWEWVQKVLLQQLIHSLILMIQQQIVGWINGNGDPQFVTDWQNLIGISYDAASSSTINRIARLACEGFDANLRVGFLPSPTYNSRFGCTISQILNRTNGSLDRFKNGFGAGGFQAYGVVLQENFFILSMETSDAALNDAIAAQGAQVKDAVAGGGFLSTKKCFLSNGTVGKPDRNTGMCSDGSKPLLTTPGQTLGAQTSKALGLGPDSVVNAQDIAGLVSAVIDASINRIIGAGLDGLLGVFATAPRVQSLADSCSGLTGQAQANCLASAGQAVTLNNSPTQNIDPGSTPGTATTIPQFNVTSTAPSGPPPTVITPVICWPPSQTVWLNPRTGSTAASVLAVGGDGTYSWLAPLGTPATLSGFGANPFLTSFTTASTTYDVTVTSNAISSTCQVTVTTDQSQASTSTPPAPTLTTLQITKAGTGIGTVTGGTIVTSVGAITNAGITCGTDCDETYSTQPSVTLTATPGAGSIFAGWSGGGCAGTGTCTLSMIQNTPVTATFNSATPANQVTCTPATRTVTLSGSAVQATITATGGNGGTTYNWSVSPTAGVSPSSALNRAGSFTARYSARNTFTVTVASGGTSASCQVIIN